MILRSSVRIDRRHRSVAVLLEGPSSSPKWTTESLGDHFNQFTYLTKHNRKMLSRTYTYIRPKSRLRERFCGLSLKGAVSINSNGRAFFLSSF